MQRKSHCVQCGRYDTEAGRISRRGLCEKCGTENMLANQHALTTKTGPAYRLYAKRQSAGFGRYIEALNAQLDAQARALDQAQRLG